MPRRAPNRIVRPVAGRHLAKSLPAALLQNTAGQVRSAADIANMTQQVGGFINPLPRDGAGFDADFGPNTPLFPAALDPVRRDSGRPEPRISEYPVSWNLPGTRGSHVPWRVLRDAAELPIISDCIRIRKEEVATLEWEIGISRKAVAANRRAQPGMSRRGAESDIRNRLMPEIARLRAFWEEPDPHNGLHFPAWIAQMLDERLVLDAIAIWPRRNIGGDVIGLCLLDGSTVKPLLDEYGGRPQPPFPAFQQILYGFPRGEFTADTVETAGGVVIPGAFSSDQLIYEVRDRRTWTPYGRSPVESALLDLDTWMKRVEWLRSEYTDGVMPSGWLVNKGGAGAVEWGPAQVLEYEMALNDLYGGDTAQRRRYRVLPPGIEPDISPDVGEKFKPDYDLHLLKLLIAHFDLTIFELGFTESTGLNGGAQHAAGQAELNNRKGSEPTLRALQAILTRISRRHLGMPDELEWRWTRLADDDSAADTLVAEQVVAGLLTFNEGRDELGRPRYEFAEADMAAVVAPRTGAVTYLDGSSLPPSVLPPSVTPPRQLTGSPVDGVDPSKPRGEDPQAGHAGRPAAPPPAPKVPAPQDAAKTAEATAYKRWLTKGKTGRRFGLEHITSPADLVKFGVDPSRVTFLRRQGGDADPKAEWPGWAVDQPVADLWATQLQAALTDAVPVPPLVRQWRQDQAPHPHRGQSDQDPSALVAAALAFLFGRGVSEALTAALIGVAADAGTEGWLVGQQSAHAVLSSGPVSWSGWTPGNPATARGLVDDPTALAAYLRGLGTADMVQTRMERLAVVMGQAVVEDWPEPKLTEAMQQVLGAPAAARAVTAAVSVGASGVVSLAMYRAAGMGQVRWVTDPRSNVCALCLANEDAGPIDVGTPFPSGDDTAPAHPNCMCAIMPV